MRYFLTSLGFTLVFLCSCEQRVESDSGARQSKTQAEIAQGLLSKEKLDIKNYFEFTEYFKDKTELEKKRILALFVVQYAPNINFELTELSNPFIFSEVRLIFPEGFSLSLKDEGRSLDLEKLMNIIMNEK